MEVQLSAELSKEFLSEKQILQESKTRNAVEDALNAQLQNKSYDIPINKQKCISIIMGMDSFEERIYYSIKR